LVALALALASSVVVVLAGPSAPARAADPCANPTNPILCENSKTGNPASEWDVNSNDDTILGFATDISVNVGSAISFKVKTAFSYTLDIYRMGYYQGLGARKITSLTPTARTQPACINDSATNLTDCGAWQVSATWNVPSSAVSGVYIAKITRTDAASAGAIASHIPFVVRNDSSASSVVFQTSDTTWQAYNAYPSSDFYEGPNGRAYKVSYNRPTPTHGENMFFSYEYPMVRFLESNGYDVSYISGIDSDRNGAALKQHRTMLTAGHDEYWSGQQRTNVQAARDAGVNLAFFAGNDMYWKTRYEASIDGASTAYRTLVCYKETWDSVKLDPSPQWTGTWRDPRFSPPSDGGLPENALVGTAYMSNNTDLALQVPAAQGKLRFWRNTSVAALAPGTTATLSPHTVGYESNEDLDNGYRPAGLIHLSTTTGAVPQYLQDFGLVVAPGTTTHNMTLYRAASGAKVFSAGTIQWSWGLDVNHDSNNVVPDGSTVPVDVRMRQATVNLLADLGALPLSLNSDLVAASASSDTTPPVSSVTSPQAGATVANGSTVTVTGSATDVGGVVGGVEVSVDGGTTWHPSTSGTTSWTYTFIAHGSGSVAIKSRATDDSGNIETPRAGVSINETCPCSLFGSAVPSTAAASDASDVTLGVKFKANNNGYIIGVRFYKDATNTGTHTGTLWSSTGTLLANGTFQNETASGWQTLMFARPVAVTAGTFYIASYRAPAGHYSAVANEFYRGDVVSGPLTAPRATQSSGNGVFAIGAAFPAYTYNGTNYYVDALFGPVGSVGPSVIGQTPAPGSVSVSVDHTVSATFDGPIQAGTTSITVQGPGSTNVPGTTTYDAGTNTATFDPTSLLPGSTTFAVTVSGAKNQLGTAMTPVSWTFTTAAAGSCPCSLFEEMATPAVVDSGDGGALELGVKFVPSVNGKVTGVRFYKASTNAGTHTGSLWSSAGVRLATGTFSTESDTGWQVLSFSSPVTVTAGSTYVASYYAPSGHYSVTSGFFGADYVRGSLTAPGSGNGLFRYGSGGGFPTSSYSGANYWVDVLFEGTVSSSPPTVTSTVPSTGATFVPVGMTVSATFDVPVQAASVNLSVSGPGNTPVAGSMSYDASTQTASFKPAATLTERTTYTVTLSGAKSLSGIAMPAPVTWSFTTEGPSVGSCPCTLLSGTAAPVVADAGDGSAVELGVKVTPMTSGVITGIKFFKSAANTGTHTGSLWSSAGTLLAKVTFTGESASGWQTAVFSSPVPVTAGASYTASYYASAGHYSADMGYFTSTVVNGPLSAAGPGVNGVFRYGTGGGFPNSTYGNANYWVDVVYDSATAPIVTATYPSASSTGAGVNTHVSVTFAEQVLPNTVSLGVTGPGSAAVAGTLSYDSTTRTMTFIPATDLAANTQYAATLSAAQSSAGVPLTAPVSWTFTTAAAGTCPCSLFNAAAVPSTVDSGDSSALELGVQLTPSVNGKITGIRFYKSAANTGTHTGSLWSSTGTLLATGTFTAESPSGWQTLTFASPVSVTAGTTYVASYYAAVGRYSVTGGYFSSSVTNGPLSAPASGNGVFRYGAGGGFPTSTYNSANYWVDVVFTL
jgi:methionine-rich copper-binding protein CopC